MRKTAYVVQKGGVGKTTLAVHHAWVKERLKRRVLMIDMDTQGCTGDKVEDAFELNVTTDKLFLPPEEFNKIELTFSEQEGGITIIRATDYLSDIVDDEVVFNFMKNLHSLDDKFDDCIIDCPPSLSMVVTAAVAASDYAVSPCYPTDDTVKGIHKLLDMIDVCNEDFGSDVKFLGFILNNIVLRSNTLKKNILHLRNENGDYVFQTVVHHREAILEVLNTFGEKAVPVWKREKDSRVASREIVRFVNELDWRISHPEKWGV